VGDILAVLDGVEGPDGEREGDAPPERVDVSDAVPEVDTDAVLDCDAVGESERVTVGVLVTVRVSELEGDSVGVADGDRDGEDPRLAVADGVERTKASVGEGDVVFERVLDGVVVGVAARDAVVEPDPPGVMDEVEEAVTEGETVFDSVDVTESVFESDDVTEGVSVSVLEGVDVVDGVLVVEGVCDPVFDSVGDALAVLDGVEGPEGEREGDAPPDNVDVSDAVPEAEIDAVFD